LTKILSVKPGGGIEPLTDLEVSLEIGNLVFAGTGKPAHVHTYESGNCQPTRSHLRNLTIYYTDTTSTTLTFLFWELSRHKDWQKKLREEIRSRTDEEFNSQQLKDLPILDAVVNEALRLHPAAPASLPREAPVGGKMMNGYNIPEKVSCMVRPWRCSV
jgi:hypothetical protein